VGEVSSHKVFLPLQAHKIQNVPDLLSLISAGFPSFLSSEDFGEGRAFDAGFEPDLNVLPDGQLRKDPVCLEGFHQPLLGHLEGAQVLDPMSQEPDLALSDGVDPRQAVEDGGLPRPVGADDAGYLFLLDSKGKAAHGLQSPEVLAEVGDFQNGHSTPRAGRRVESGFYAPAFSALRNFITIIFQSPTDPLGMNMMVTIKRML
jgi:hypothetical protein